MDLGDCNLAWLQVSDCAWAQVKNEEQRFGWALWIWGESFVLFVPEMAANCGWCDWNLGSRSGLSARVLLKSWPFVAFWVANHDSDDKHCVWGCSWAVLQPGWAVVRILMNSLVFCALAATGCRVLGGWSPSKAGEELLLQLFFFKSSCLAVPLEMFCALRTPWDTALLWFTLLWFRLC